MNLPDFSKLDIKPAQEQIAIDIKANAPQIIATPTCSDLSKHENNMRIVLQLYQYNFGDRLDIIKKEFKDLDKKNYDQLKALIDQCDKLIGSSTAIETKKNMILAAVTGVEKVLIMSGINCEGLSHTLKNDQGFQDDILRIALKQLATDEPPSPETSAMYRFGMTLLMIHSENEKNGVKIKMQTTIDNIPQQSRIAFDNIKPIDPIESLVTEYADL